MSTAIVETRKQPPASGRAEMFEQHKADILGGGDGLASGRKLGLLLGEIHANAAMFARRTKLAHELRVAVPRLEVEARKAKSRSERLLALGDRPFTATTSADWLVALNLPADATLQQFAQRLAQFPDHCLKSKQTAQETAQRAGALREQATRGLWESASAALHDRLRDVQERMLGAGSRIEAADRWLREIDARLQRAGQRCEQLFRGEQSDGGRSPSEAMRRRYEAAKEYLRKLQAEAATRPQVEAQRARHASEHAAALAQRNETLAAMLLPENMRFHGDR